MIKFIICGLLLSVTSYVQGAYTSDYEYFSHAGGWLKLHKVAATWQQAFLQCYYEGAVLASPLTREIRRAMQLLIDNNDNSLSYFIGANSKFTPGQYVSIEGVPLANMPVDDMYQLIDTEHIECLKTDGLNISIASCSARLPYLCYTKAAGKSLTECGTFDKQYRLERSTGSCYKVHVDLRTWPEANAMCVSEGGYLAILNDADEASIVTNMIPDIRVPWITSNVQWEPLYIGLLDWTGNGTWLTNHGDTLDQVFGVWHKNQPDDIPGQLCGAINRLGKFDNIWCEGKRSYFICEKNPQDIRYFFIDARNTFTES